MNTGGREFHVLATAAPTIGKVTAAAPPGLPGFDLDRQPAVRAEAGRLGPLWVQACSLAGRSHIEGPNPSSGQDSYSYRLSEDGKLAVLAVADGLGSRARSHVGAQVAAVEACTRFCESSVRHLLDGPIGRVVPDRSVLAAMTAVQRRLEDAGARGSGGSDVATTVLVAMVELGVPEPRVAFVRVGDPAALLMVDGRFTDRSMVFGAPPTGAANSLSACLPMRSPEREVEVVRVGALPAGVAVVLVTDGVGNDLAGSAQLRQWFEQRWAQPLDAAAMIDTLRYRRQGSVDDRTALVVYNTPVLGGRGVVDGLRSQPQPQPLPAPPTADASREAAAAPTPRRRSAAALIAVGASAVAVGAVAALLLTSGSDDGGENGTPVALVQSAAPDTAAASIVVPGGDAARAVAFDPAAVGDDRVITAFDGQLVAVDGCLDMYQVAEPLRPEQRELTCDDPRVPTLVAPAGASLVVVRDDEVHVPGASSRSLGAAATNPVVESAVDVTSVGDVLVFAGPSGVATLVDGSDVVAVDGLDAALASPAGDCAEPVYRSVEATGDDRVAVAATCGDGGWAIAVVDPRAGTGACVAVVGDGPAPVPFEAGEGRLRIAVPAFGAAGAVVTSDLDTNACRDGG